MPTIFQMPLHENDRYAGHFFRFSLSSVAARRHRQMNSFSELIAGETVKKFVFVHISQMMILSLTYYAYSM